VAGEAQGESVIRMLADELISKQGYNL